MNVQAGTKKGIRTNKGISPITGLIPLHGCRGNKTAIELFLAGVAGLGSRFVAADG